MTVNTVYLEGADGGVSPFSSSPTSPLLYFAPLSSPAFPIYPSPHLVSFPSPFLLSHVFTPFPPFPALPLSYPSPFSPSLPSSLSAPTSMRRTMC